MRCKLENVILLGVIIAAELIPIGCGGGSATPEAPSPPPPALIVSVSPASATVNQGATQAFTATVAGTTNTAVTWTVEEGAPGGSITSAGVYTAPAAAGTFHIVATSQVDATKSAVANVAIPTVSISITPQTDTLGPAGMRTFTSVVTGTVDTAVTWSIEEGATGGSITSDGIYTATATTGTYHVLAISATDATATSAATLTVVSSGFTPSSSMETPRAGHTATLLPNGKVLIAGGSDGASVLQSAEIFDPATDTFSSTGSLVSARRGHTATLLPNGKVLILGGFSNSNEILATAELYDPAKGTFTATGSMSVPRGDYTATLLADGRVLVAGGADDNFNYLATAEIYDPATGLFTPTGNLITARAFHAATLLTNGEVLLAGGCCGDSGNGIADFDSAELYDPVAGTFLPAGALREARADLTMTLLPDGRVLAAGGKVDETVDACTANLDADTPCFGMTDFADLYDPSTEAFTETGHLNVPRFDHTATQLPSGSVLVVGGIDSVGQDESTESTYTSELYDPATGTFSFTGSLETARTGHTATLLNDGRVIVIGGVGDCTSTSCVVLASAEIYK